MIVNNLTRKLSMNFKNFLFRGFMTKNKSILSKKILSSIVFLLFFNGLLASNSKKIVFSNYEQKILKNLRITPANFLLKANDFTTQTSNGRKVSLKDFHGRFIFLNFCSLIIVRQSGKRFRQ